MEQVSGRKPNTHRTFRSPNGELLHGNGTVVRAAPRDDATSTFEQEGAKAAWETTEANETANIDYCDTCEAVTPTNHGICSGCGTPS